LMPLLGFAGPAALVAPVGVIARILSLFYVPYGFVRL